MATAASPAAAAAPAAKGPAAPVIILSHEAHEQLPGLRYCIQDNPTPPLAVILGFQHYLINLATIVIFTNIIVPLMGGNSNDKARIVETTLFVSGVNTLLQTTLGSRLPVIEGISFAYLIPIISIINSPRLATIDDDPTRFRHTLRATQGALIAASGVQIVLGFSGIWGLFARILTPVALVPAIVLTSLGLYAYGFPEVAKCIEIGLPTILLALLFSQYLWHFRIKVRTHFHVFELFPIIITLAIVWGYAYILTVSGAYKHASSKGQLHCRTDRADAIGPAPWVRFPYPFEWGAPTFNAADAFGIMSAVLVSVAESTAAFHAASRISGASPPPPYVISRGIGWGGVGILLAACWGTASGVSVSIENVGLLGLTRVGSRRVVQIAALWMILFAIFGKFGGFFASIPVPLFAGFITILFGIVAAVGISLLQFTNLNKTRNLFIIGFALYLGFSIPFYFYQYTSTAGYGPVHTDARWFNNIVNVFFLSGAVVAFLVGTILDNSMRSKAISKKDRGLHWFEKFHEYGRDARNEEFYKLPYVLHRYFPPPK